MLLIRLGLPHWNRVERLCQLLDQRGDLLLRSRWQFLDVFQCALHSFDQSLAPHSRDRSLPRQYIIRRACPLSPATRPLPYPQRSIMDTTHRAPPKGG